MSPPPPQYWIQMLSIHKVSYTNKVQFIAVSCVSDVSLIEVYAE
jgi:hypothetical protein